MSYEHTFLNLKITISDIRPHINWVVILVIAYVHFNIPEEFMWVVWVNILTLSPPRVTFKRTKVRLIFLKFSNKGRFEFCTFSVVSPNFNILSVLSAKQTLCSTLPKVTSCNGYLMFCYAGQQRRKRKPAILGSAAIHLAEQSTTQGFGPTGSSRVKAKN